MCSCSAREPFFPSRLTTGSAGAMSSWVLERGQQGTEPPGHLWRKYGTSEKSSLCGFKPLRCWGICHCLEPNLLQLIGQWDLAKCIEFFLLWYIYACLFIYLSERERSHPIICSPSAHTWSWAGNRARNKVCNPGLQHGWLEPDFLCRHGCLPWSALAGGWSREPKPCVEARHCVLWAS